MKKEYPIITQAPVAASSVTSAPNGEFSSFLDSSNGNRLSIKDSTGAISFFQRSGTQQTTSATTFTINSDFKDLGVITAQAAALTIAAPTGTPIQGQKLIFRIKDNGTARGITWNAIFRIIGTTLPTTTVINKTTYVGCIYNSTDTKWDVVVVNTEA